MSLVPKRVVAPSFIAASAFFALTLATASWVYLFVDQDAEFATLFSSSTWSNGWSFFEQLLGVSERSPDTPAFLEAAEWKNALGLAYDTLAMSVLAIGLASIGALLTVVPAARMRDTGSSSRLASGFRSVVFLAVRITYVFSRGVPELLWALVIVFVLSPGILAGAVALAIHNYGIVGKLWAEVLEDMDSRPNRALRASGASGAQVLVYGVLPQVSNQFLTYMLYRWEVIIRTTIVVGFVAAGGLGREFQLSMSFFHYTDVMLLLIVYFMLVVMVDMMSAGLRQLAR